MSFRVYGEAGNGFIFEVDRMVRQSFRVCDEADNGFIFEAEKMIREADIYGNVPVN
jgi:hypothetical protein